VREPPPVKLRIRPGNNAAGDSPALEDVSEDLDFSKQVHVFESKSNKSLFARSI